jgi:hypothetical protein
MDWQARIGRCRAFRKRAQDLLNMKRCGALAPIVHMEVACLVSVQMWVQRGLGLRPHSLRLDSPPTLSTVGSLYRHRSSHKAEEAVAVFTGIVPATGQGRSRRIPTSSDLHVPNTTFVAVNPRRASVPSGRLSYQALKESLAG